MGYNMLWFRDDGNNTHAINYPLNKNSLVFEFGGYKGAWASQIISKYNPNICIFEPVKVFYKLLLNKFKYQNKVKIYNYGVSTKNTRERIYLNNDSTSLYRPSEESEIVQLKTVETILKELRVNKVDLVQFNIEGEEFDLLENMLDTGSVLNFENIQIQFHRFIRNSARRRALIQRRLAKNFTKIYDYPFVFESWKRIKRVPKRSLLL